MQVQTIQYGLNYTIRIKKQEVISLIYSLKYYFETQSNFVKFFITKELFRWKHSYLTFTKRFLQVSIVSDSLKGYELHVLKHT